MNEEKQKQHEAKYLLASIIESSQDSIVSIDLNRVITSWNKGAEDLYGYSAAQAIGKSLEMVMLPQDIVDLIGKVDKISHEIVVPLYETVRLHKNGKEADLQIALSPIRDSSGKVVGISTIARDITEVKLQEQLKDEFIAVASHELKTPVTSIKAYTDLLIEKFENSQDEAMFLLTTKLGAQVDRMIQLIRTLLDTTKLAGGEMLLSIEEFDLSTLIKEQIEPLQLVSPRHQIMCENEEVCNMAADRKLIGQVINNLLTNAVKYSPKGGKVIVSIEQTTQEVRVNVQDFGIGIPDGLSHKIFERYFRVNSSQTSPTPSIGLGLYIIAKIIDQHGGKIFVESVNGEGSTFSFLIPKKIINRNR
ncbi:MAG: sensor histidine kinase [Agriterribacter sp.]